VATAGRIHAQSRLVRDSIRSAALAGNRLGDNPTREVLVYLPASYATEPNRRYPVLYFLHGFTSHPTEWIDGSYPGLNLQTAMDTLTAKHSLPEYIVVMPDVDNRLGGGFYENSPVAGGWADFVVHDLVNYVDGHYRTINNRAHRALAGHSMGGFGALVLGLANPAKFGLLYVMSPCCVSFVGELAPSSPAWAAAAEAKSWTLPGAPPGTRFVVALAVALSADTSRTLGYGELPFGTDGGRLVARPSIVERWEARMPTRLARRLVASGGPRPLIYLDFGSRDQIASVDLGVAALTRTFDGLGVRYTSLEFDGGHVDRVPDRVAGHLLPTVGEWMRRPNQQ